VTRNLQQSRKLLKPAILALLLAPLALAAQAGQGPGGPGSGGGGPPDGSGPSRSHDRFIQFDDTSDEYVLTQGGVVLKRVPKGDVERSLSTALCGECHKDAVAQLKNSIHFSAQGPNPRILFPGGGAHGALDRACGLPGTTALINYTSNVNLGECGKCHVGRFLPPMQNAFTSVFLQMGMPPKLAATNATNLVDGGLDCLICHADHYLSVRDDIDWTLQTLEIAGYAEPGGAFSVAAGLRKTCPRRCGLRSRRGTRPRDRCDRRWGRRLAAEAGLER